jgi:hypothetical protein
MTWVLGLALFQLICSILTLCARLWEYHVVSKNLEQARKARGNFAASSKKARDHEMWLRAARNIEDQ